MPYENMTLGALLSDPRVAPVADSAIRCRDLKKEPLWNKTLSRLKEERPELLVREEVQPLTGGPVTDSSTRFGAFLMAAREASELRPWLPAEE